MKSFFVSCMIDGRPELFETLNVCRLLQQLTRWAMQGESVECVTIKPTRKY